ncbi:hypothetical protein GTP91_13035 [Rugamonas sp. FT82W]|uniref:AlgX/AlgJ SGNH hydrolase-like domain-containing protein n=1 Tax=Duganella vulcania TaxID=2692166 RepID=A0A845G5D2_9BURK|nr:hypothetical protein [Duganella vulcania]MYM88099.1 hypothetical protein [Duganella vulcania]
MRTSFYLFLGVAFALSVLEAVLQLAPVNSGPRKLPTSADAPNFRFVPDQRYTYSVGWALDNARRGLINHDGFNNSLDMRDGAKAIVLGDSYIEALMLDYPDTVQGQLDQALGGGVYAASASGNGLADSLQLMRELGPKFHPKNVILFVEAYDVSTLLEAPQRGHSGFVIKDGVVGMAHNNYQESKAKTLVFRSALARYTFNNLKFPNWFSAKMASLRRRGPQAAPDAAVLAAQRRQMLDYYFDQLHQLSAQQGSKVIFLIDADREQIYHDSPRSVSWQPGDREWIVQRVRDSGFALADMQPAFAQDWRQRHERFDFEPLDGHWNKLAHALAAKRIEPLLAASRD